MERPMATLTFVTVILCVVVFADVPTTEKPVTTFEAPQKVIVPVIAPIEITETEKAPLSKATESIPVAQEIVVPALLPETSSDEAVVTRVQNPYPTPSIGLDAVNTLARPSVVNIVCLTPTNAGIQPISGSGVVVSNTGVVLTNAHVAQYVLLKDTTRIAITCTARSGSPAVAYWEPRVLYISEQWMKKHATDITSPRPTGTGEHDVALLVLTPLPNKTPPAFNPLTPETREGLVFDGDQALVGAYPAGFASTIAVNTGLALTTSPTTIGELYTFKGDTIDLFSVGGLILAQGGASGGPVLNPWGYVIGLVVTSTDAEETKDRDLRAISIAHVDRTLRDETGRSLASFLSNTIADARSFADSTGHMLGQLLFTAIENR